MPWSYFDWILTMRPGVFGLHGGIANPTGVALIAIDTVMTIGSMPFIRKKKLYQACHMHAPAVQRGFTPNSCRFST